MKGSLYRERDYALGQTFLTLRITIGLTQADLAPLSQTLFWEATSYQEVKYPDVP